MRRFSLRWIAPVLIGGLVLGVSLAVGMLGVAQGRETATELGERTLAQVHERIRDRLDAVMGLPPRVNRVNYGLITTGLLDAGDPRSWRTVLFEQSLAFPRLSCICWGDVEGRATWFARYSERTRLDYAIKDDATGGDVHEYYYAGEAGEIDAEPKATYQYDPRTRPWYTHAIAAGGPHWSAPFAWITEGGKTPTLGISYARPVHGADGKLLGVIDTELTLHEISNFLHALSIGVTGHAFIVDAQGVLIANSRAVAVTTDEGDRISAAACGDLRIERVIGALPGSLETIRGSRRFEFEVDGERVVGEATRYGDSEGLDWVVVTAVPEDDFLGPVNEANRRSIVFGLMAVVVAVGLGLILGGRLARPVRALRDHVRRIGKGDFDARIELGQSSEFVALSEAMNEMSEALLDRRRMRQSLAMAMEVQQSLLPSEDPDHPGIDVSGHSTYCDETGGDYYDFLDISGTHEHTLNVAVGDVMGHGIAAAMLMATARGILHSRSRHKGGLAELMEHMNELLVRDTAGERFMTMLLMTIDVPAGTVRWASAGHGPPMIYDPKTRTFVELARGQLPLGLVDGVAYHENVYTELEPGQIIIAATDGLWETRNMESEEFGMDRLKTLVGELATLSADRISHALREAVAEWCHPRKPDDDLTFVVMKISE